MQANPFELELEKVRNSIQKPVNELEKIYPTRVLKLIDF